MPDPQLRAADSDREAVAATLGRALHRLVAVARPAPRHKGGDNQRDPGQEDCRDFLPHRANGSPGVWGGRRSRATHE